MAMSSRREVLLGGASALAAGLLPFGRADPAPVSYDDVAEVRPHNVTGYALDDAPNLLGMEHVTGYDAIGVNTGGDETTLRVDIETTADVSVRAEGAVSRAELVALRREIDAALEEIDV